MAWRTLSRGPNTWPDRQVCKQNVKKALANSESAPTTATPLGERGHAQGDDCQNACGTQAASAPAISRLPTMRTHTAQALARAHICDRHHSVTANSELMVDRRSVPHVPVDFLPPRAPLPRGAFFAAQCVQRAGIRCRAAITHNSATPTETRLRGWGGRTRTQKCRRKLSL